MAYEDLLRKQQVVHVSSNKLEVALMVKPVYTVEKMQQQPQQQRDSSIPRVIFQSYHSKRLVPDKVATNFKAFAADYTRYIYNDTECLQFLQQYFHEAVVLTYHQLEGPHRADLFRYAVLYINGGIYIDIKTELLRPVQGIFSDPPINPASSRKVTFTVISPAKITGSSESRSCFQGVIGTSKGNPLFLRLIHHLVSATKPVIDYLITTKHIYELISDDTGHLLNGGLNRARHNTSEFDYFLFEEKKRDLSECYDGPDRYGGCYFIFQGDTKVMKTRYSDYPWDKKVKKSSWPWTMLGLR